MRTALVLVVGGVCCAAGVRAQPAGEAPRGEPPIVTPAPAEVTPGAAAGPEGPTGPLRAGEPAPSTAADRALEIADELLERGDLEGARRLYLQIVRDHYGTWAAQGAARALHLMNARDAAAKELRPAPPPAPVAPKPAFRTREGLRLEIDAPPGETDPLLAAAELWSLRTREEIAISPWEWIDFTLTCMYYGGIAGGLSAWDDDSTAITTLTGLTLGLVPMIYGVARGVDRGDLPAMLLPVSHFTRGAVALAAMGGADAGDSSFATPVGVAGLLSLPTAILLAETLDPDPGDWGLVRSSGVWGSNLALLGALAARRDWDDTGRTYAWATFLGLMGGTGLGVIGAVHGEPSLDRVNAAIWAGYAGSVIGMLFGIALGVAGDDDSQAAIFVPPLVFSLAGLLGGYALTGHLDELPEDAVYLAPAAAP
jgi:hypothetical protein